MMTSLKKNKTKDNFNHSFKRKSNINNLKNNKLNIKINKQFKRSNPNKHTLKKKQ